MRAHCNASARKECCLHNFFLHMWQAALDLLEQSLQKAPLALAAAKAAVDDGSEVPVHKGMAFERAHYARLFSTDDRIEALRAFAEKRAPTFAGR